MTCDEFTRLVDLELHRLGFDPDQREVLLGDAERVDELHGDMLTPERAARELIADIQSATESRAGMS